MPDQQMYPHRIDHRASEIFPLPSAHVSLAHLNRKHIPSLLVKLLVLLPARSFYMQNSSSVHDDSFTPHVHCCTQGWPHRPPRPCDRWKAYQGHVVNDPMTQRDIADPMTQLGFNNPA